MEKKESTELIHKVERLLAEELMEYMKKDGVTLHWNDTTQHLVEAIHYLYISELMREDNGLLMTKKRIADMVFARFHVAKPCNLSTYLSRVRNIKGKKSVTLLSQNVSKMQRFSMYEGIARYVDAS